MRYIRDIIASTIITAFITVAVFGLAIVDWQMSNTAKSGHSSGCPLMTNITTMCPMNFESHVAIWHKVTQAHLLKKILLLVLALVVSFSVNLQKLFKKSLAWYETNTTLTKLFLPPSLQPRAP